jgi:hypothetical protein
MDKSEREPIHLTRGSAGRVGLLVSVFQILILARFGVGEKELLHAEEIGDALRDAVH